MTRARLGQHFLSDRAVIEKILESAELGTDDLVVEIGPGTGMLTHVLCEKVRKVIAIELDAKLYERLKASLAAHENLELVHGNALDYPYENLPEFSVVANIPYYITTPLLFKLLEAKKNLRSMTLTVQKEVAERIVARPGGRDYGVLSVMVQYRARASIEFIVPREAFRPVPKVDSAVVRIRVLPKPVVTVNDEAAFFRIVRTAFSQRRKMLSNSLRVLRGDIGRLLREAGIDPRRRAETISFEEFARLSNLLSRGHDVPMPVL